MLNLLIIWRYIRGRSRRGLSLTAVLSFMGVFIGTSLLVIVMSVFNGFQAQIKKSIFKFDPHISIEKQTAPGIIKDWQSWIDKVNEDGKRFNIKSVEPMIQSAAIIRKGSVIDHIMIRGQYMKEAEPLEGSKIKNWVIPSDFPRIVKPKGLRQVEQKAVCLIGREMAINMNIRIGDSIQVIVPRGQFTARVGIKPRIRRYKVAGLFKTGHYDYDSKVVVLPFAQAQKLYDVRSGTQKIVAKVDDLSNLDRARYHVTRVFPLPFYVHTLEDDQRNFFAALQIEKIAVTIIVFLFVIASIFIIVIVTLFMVRTKKRDIGILKALGLSNSSVLWVFTLVGFSMAFLGTILGVLSGIYGALSLQNIIEFFEKYYNKIGKWYTETLFDGLWIHRDIMPDNVYYFDKLPVSIEPGFITVIAISAIVLAVLGSLIPAFIASRYDPMEIIRRGDV